VIQKSDFAAQHEEPAMRFARAPFTIRSLVGVMAVTVGLVGGAIVLLRHPAPMTPTMPPGPKKSGIIMEGVDINSNGAGAPERERHSSPRKLFPPELRSDLQRSDLQR
jgi:hypothetical protein